MKQPRNDTEIKFVCRFPKEEIKQNIDRLKKKIQNEFTQLKAFKDMGKLIFIEVDSEYFKNKQQVIKDLENLIKNYTQLTAIILVISSSFKHGSRELSCVIIKNKENNYPLPEKFYGLLEDS